jgi:hypothetical protein
MTSPQSPVGLPKAHRSVTSLFSAHTSCDVLGYLLVEMKLNFIV